MTNNDLDQIKGVLKEEIDKALDKRLSVTEKIFDEKLTATEKRLRTEIAAVERRLKSEITDSGDNIIEEIAGFMEVNILPKFEGKADKSGLDRIEGRTDRLADKVSQHDVRFKNIESIPVIAHQLKIKKAK